VSSSAWVPGFRVRFELVQSFMFVTRRNGVFWCVQHSLESLPNYHSWQAGSVLKKDCEACKRTNHPATY
jgi:hypothetical protein